MAAMNSVVGDKLDLFRSVRRDSGSSHTIKHIAHPREWVSIRGSWGTGEYPECSTGRVGWHMFGIELDQSK
jgi:hypothetical protein